jgi:glycosyl transferase family 87
VIGTMADPSAPAAVTPGDRLTRLAPIAAWLLTRAVMVAFLAGALPYLIHPVPVNDVADYHRWSQILEHGMFPHDDQEWQYPPGAALVMWAPMVLANRLFSVSYLNAFYTLVLICDLVAFTLLHRLAGRMSATGGGALPWIGVWAWVVGLFAVGPIAYARYDVIVAVFAVAALAVGPLFGARRWTAWTRGVFLGLGALLKLWPGALLLGEPRGRDGRRSFVAAVLAAAVPTLVLLAALPGGLSFLTYQDQRGLEIESVAATPLMLLRLVGVHHRADFVFGAYQLDGSAPNLIAHGCTYVTVAVMLALLWWRRRMRWTSATPADVGFAAVLVAVVTTRVLSAQYMLWLVGLVAMCWMFRETTQRVACALVFAAILLNQLEYPLAFESIVNGGVAATLLLALRNALLVAATVASLVGLYRARTPRPPKPSVPAQGTSGQGAPAQGAAAQGTTA